MPRRIIIDTDPGQDDAVAILTALASPAELTVEAIVTVAGNVPLSRTSLNALKIVELAGRADVPVYAGAAKPLNRPGVTAEHVHGPSGLNGPDLPEPAVVLQTENGVDYLVRAFRAAEPGAITLCTLGPLTNVALALRQAPDIAPRIKEIVMMAGAYFEGGNITPTAEFNVYVDPEALAEVMAADIPVVMMPLDVTHKALMTPERLGRIRAVGNRAATAVWEMLTFSERFDLRKYGWPGAPLHDPCVIAYLLKPELFGGRHVNVAVEVAGEFTTGMTVADWWGVTARPANALFMRDLDADGFADLLVERLARLP
jgi:purine nucleosidase